MKPPNPPRKHHYNPVFYLRRWAGVDGKLTEYSRPYRRVVTKRVGAEYTGFQEGLYELRGFEPELAQQVEELFLKPIDTEAAAALDLIEKNGNRAPWTDRSRTAWTRLILSMLLRCPEDIEAFRSWWHEDFVRSDDGSEARYRMARESDDPPTFADFLKAQPITVIERYQYEIWSKLVNHEDVGQKINNMHWRILEMPPSAIPLLTSDRPVIWTNLGESEGHIALPLGPRRLFMASHSADFLNRLEKADRLKLAKECNRLVVEGAARYVYGTDERHLRFVENRIGKNPQPRLMQSIVARRRSKHRDTS